MARARVTLRDVARRVGVHPSTVSRALNPLTRPMVARDIATRALAAARALGYHRNPIALSLKTSRSLVVGVLVPDLTNPVFPPILRGIEDALTGAGYTVVLTNTDNDLARERVILERMLARRVDGLVMATARRRDPVVARCLAEGIPLVLINRTIDAQTVPAVVNDDALGIRAVVAHMVAQGHRRIAHVGGPLALSTGFARRAAFLAAVRHHGLEAESKLTVACRGYSDAEGCRALRALWARDRGFTAVVAANDLLALGCYDAALELGLRIPEDLSVSGFNDMPFVDRVRPPLTTLRIPHYEMGAQAARLLLLRLQDRATAPQHIFLKPELMLRGSTGPARAAARIADAPAREPARRSAAQ